MGNTIQRLLEGSTFTCGICRESMSSNKRFKNKAKRRCIRHPFCVDCIAKYVCLQVEDNSANIKCPGLKCKQLLDPIKCMPLIPNKVFDKWCDNLYNRAILELDTCYCPNKKCSILIVNECGGTVKYSKCPNCMWLFCFWCKSPWDNWGHVCGETEEVTQVRNRNHVLFQQLVEKMNWRRCPGCEIIVERISGCSLIVCRCQTSFCYRCGKQHTDNACAPSLITNEYPRDLVSPSS